MINSDNKSPKRKKEIKFKVNDEELKSINDRKPRGTTRAAWIKSLALGEPIRKSEPIPHFDPAVKLAIDAIGRNINQLVKQVHQGKLSADNLELSLCLYLDELRLLTDAISRK